MRGARIRNGWFGTLFLVGIFVPFVGFLWGLVIHSRDPVVHVDKPLFALGVQTWTVEQIGRLRVFYGGASSSSRVILGHDGWLFLGDAAVVDNIEGKDPYRPGELERCVKSLQAAQIELAGIHSKLLILVAPEKSSVYGDELPSYLQISNPIPQNRTDGFVNACRAASVPIVDLRGALSRARRRGVVPFQKLDTHWNDTGAATAASATIDELKTLGFSLSMPKLTFQIHAETGGDLARFLGLRSELIEVEQRLQSVNGASVDTRSHPEETVEETLSINSNKPGLPTMMMFRDSFGTRLTPILARSFSKATVLWPSLPYIDMKRVKADKPDLVILELVERYLTHDWQPVR